MRALEQLTGQLDRLILSIGRLAGLFFLVNTAVILIDVLTRRVGYQIPGLGSTRLQELEWYVHTILFSLVLGATYVQDAHVRVDVVVGSLSKRARAWLELSGCVLLALPFLFVTFRYGYDFVVRSFVIQEGSVSPQGLPARYIIKSVFMLGFCFFFLSVVSAILRSILTISGRTPPEKPSLVEQGDPA